MTNFKIFTKYILTFVIFLFSNFCYSQSDTIKLNTPAIFSITFHEEKEALIFKKDYTSYDEVYLDVITKEYLIFKKKYHDEKKPNAVSTIRRIPLKDIKALGYSTVTKESFGTFLGMGIGVVTGTIVAIVAKSFDRDAIDAKYDSSTSK